jgi:hypothetical protein
MLKPAYALRVALAIEWLLICAIALSPYCLTVRLPPALQTYLDRVGVASWSASSRLSLVLSCICIVIGVASSIALWFFHRWARLPYAASRIGAIVVAVFGGPLVEDSLSFTLEGLWMFVSGIVVALIYYGGIERFQPQKA